MPGGLPSHDARPDPTRERPGRGGVLILGGTGEAYALARRLAGWGGGRVITSLAGRTKAPRQPEGDLRIGGFGGPAGLSAWLLAEGIAAVVDATHPFAARMGWNAAAGCAAAGVPLLRLQRPAWVPGAGDRWEEVDDVRGAATALVGIGSRRIFLAVGRQDVQFFAEADTASGGRFPRMWFLVRSVETPEPRPPFANLEILLARGPFALDDERTLLHGRAIDTVVCKNSGGPGTDAKLTAAREQGITVVMVRRPARPPLTAVATVDDATQWLSAQIKGP